MKVFDIEDGYSYSQTHSVVAENMAEAERILNWNAEQLLAHNETRKNL